MTEPEIDAETPPSADRRPWWPLALVVLLGLVVGGGAGLLLVLVRDDDPGNGSSDESTVTTAPVDLVGALVEAGVPEPLLDCVTGSITDGGHASVAAAAEAPLALSSDSRDVVEACARDHLAAEVQAGADIAGTDAQCVAGALLEQVGLEAVLASIDALAVSAEVQQAAAEAAEVCAAAG